MVIMLIGTQENRQAADKQTVSRENIDTFVKESKMWYPQ